MPRRGGNQEETGNESAQADNNAILAQIMEKLDAMSTRIEALEARSRPPTPILPTVPLQTPQSTTRSPLHKPLRQPLKENTSGGGQKK